MSAHVAEAAHSVSVAVVSTVRTVRKWSFLSVLRDLLGVPPLQPPGAFRGDAVGRRGILGASAALVCPAGCSPGPNSAEREFYIISQRRCL
jgi:hypothetical protein